MCKDIEKTINQTIQNTLNHLERDCDEIGQKVEQAIATDNQARSHNLRAGGKGYVSYYFSISFHLKSAFRYMGTKYLNSVSIKHIFLLSLSDWS